MALSDVVVIVRRLVRDGHLDDRDLLAEPLSEFRFESGS